MPSVQDVIGDAFLILASAAAGLIIFELCLSDIQKNTWNNRLYTAWSSLDDLSRKNANLLFLNRRAQITVISLLFAVSATFGLIVACVRYPEWEHSFCILLTTIIYTIILLRIVPWLCAKGTTKSYLQKAFVLLILCGSPFLILDIPDYVRFETGYGSGYVDNASHAAQQYVFDNSPYFTIIIMVTSLMSFMLAFIAMIFHYGISAFSFIIRNAEFFLRRIAEYPKGPLAALAALFGALAALLKLMQ